MLLNKFLSDAVKVTNQISLGLVVFDVSTIKK